MVGKVAEIRDLVTRDQLAGNIAHMWETYVQQRGPWEEECKELRNYVFATSTRDTSNAKLPWKNSTTLPKLTQIRDNLHANYLSALFPNDDWLRWEAYSTDPEDRAKAEAIQAYMSNKTRESNFRTTMSQLLYDYIDYGNAIAGVTWVNETTVDDETGEPITGYVGPKAVRYSPYDIVINPIALEWKDTPKIHRTIKTIGELKWESANRPDLKYIDEAIRIAEEHREALAPFRQSDVNKALGYTIDGFGSLQEYYQSGNVELLELEGTVHDPVTGEFLQNYVITVIDRSIVLRKEPNPSWLGQGNKQHVGWRLRPDNLYAMGPLANLVGMQYRLDHLENLKADLMDLAAFPPLAIKGNVDEFEWGPLAKVYMDEAGDIDLLKVDSAGLQADLQINLLEQKMEEFAGAPKQAMGIRTPGEKTAFEVQQLQNAAGRIFQEKITNFEINLLEPLLNAMLEMARRNMDGSDVIRVMDDDLGVEVFLDVTKDDITAKGKIRPIGARHFAAQAQLVQNLVQLSNTPVWQETAPHRSSKALASMVEDVMGLGRFELFQDNIAITEQLESQQLLTQAQTKLQQTNAAATPQQQPVEGVPPSAV
jgi:hypothetical protein